MEEREKIIRLWFAMWLQRKDLGISQYFSEGAGYIESWGPEYHGSAEIQHWFIGWNTRGRVLVWNIKQFFHKQDRTIVEWFFKCKMDDGREQAFDGISLVEWSQDGKIKFLKEFGCNIDRYNPYQNGPVPTFKGENSLWF